MKKSIIVSSLLFAAVTAFAQSNDYNTIMDITDDASLVQENASVEFPYSKVLNATDSDLLAQRFRNDTYHNCWILTHSNGWGVVASILSDVNTPVKTDYKIRVQNGEGGKRSSVEVTFFDPEIYQAIITFGQENASDFTEIKKGKGALYKYTYAGYAFTLEYSYEEVKVTRAVTGSSENRKYSTSHATTEDYSYDKYVYTINTGVPAESDYLREQAAKDAKRAAKGKKSRSSEAFM